MGIVALTALMAMGVLPACSLNSSLGHADDAATEAGPDETGSGGAGVGGTGAGTGGTVSTGSGGAGATGAGGGPAATGGTGGRATADAGTDLAASGGAGGEGPDASAGDSSTGDAAPADHPGDAPTTDGPAGDASTCPAEAPPLNATCGSALAGDMCTYKTDTGDAGVCLETYTCRCLSDQMGGLDCNWTRSSLDCQGGGELKTCNPLSGAALQCGDAALSCLECPTGPITAAYYCSTPCKTNDDCHDDTRPVCNHRDGASGLCAPASLTCAWGVRCASPETPIATPEGDRPLGSLREGDLVFSTDHRGRLVIAPIVRAVRVPAAGHFVVEVTLRGGRRLEVSAAHPTADGRTFADLAPGQHLGDAVIASVRTVPYRFAHTYDILPASATGTYFAAGALIGSTLGGNASRPALASAR